MGRCMYVLTIITNNPKYLDQFLMVLLETFTTGLIFARQLKQGVTGGCIPACTGWGVYPSMHWAVGVYPSMHWAGGVYPGGV